MASSWQSLAQVRHSILPEALVANCRFWTWQQPGLAVYPSPVPLSLSAARAWHTARMAATRGRLQRRLSFSLFSARLGNPFRNGLFGNLCGVEFGSKAVCVAFSGDGQKLAFCADNSPTLMVLSCPWGLNLGQAESQNVRPTRTLSYAPDGRSARMDHRMARCRSWTEMLAEPRADAVVAPECQPSPILVRMANAFWCSDRTRMPNPCSASMPAHVS